MAQVGDPLDAVVAHLHPFLKSEGFKKRKGLFNRETSGGLVHVVEVVNRDAERGDHIALEVGIFSRRLHALVEPPGRGRSWVAVGYCHFQDPLPLRDPDDPDRRGYHPAFAGRVLLEQLRTSVVPFLTNYSDMNDLVAVVPKQSIWGTEMDTEALIRLLADSGETLRAHALLQREYAASGPERRVELRALAASVPQLVFEAADDVETDETFLAQWTEGQQERFDDLMRLASEAPDAVPSGRFPEVLARPRYEVKPGGMLDASRESLDELWRWLLALHPQLHAHTTDPQPLEARYRFPSMLTSAELWLAELLAVYLARVLRRRNPELRWGLDENGHLGLVGKHGFVDLLDRTCLAVLWVKQPPMELAQHLRVDELNQLVDVMLYAEAELG